MAAGGRYGDLDLEGIDQLTTDVHSKNTLKSTKYAVKIMGDYCVSKGYDPEFERLSNSDLNNLLKEFYANVRRVNGEYYNISSFIVIRQSLNRHLTQPPHNKNLDILMEREFHEANNVFKSMCKKLRKDGKGQIKNKNAIDIGDIRKLYEHKRVFNIHTPCGLLNKVWFELLLYFCRRGQENLREMNPCHFEVAFDGEGKQFVHRVSSELTKNHQGNVNEHYEPAGGRMYATGTELCPVASFVKYVSKLHPKCEALWQRPRNSFDDSDKYWYEDKPLGKNTLAVMMSNISKQANLSQEYTNHCVRATCITVLSESGFEARHIVTLSGHRNEQSIQTYVRDTSTAQKQKMSASISLFTAAAQIENVPLVTNSNQENENSTNVIGDDLNDSDLDLNSEYDNIIASINRGEKVLQPLSDITNVPLMLPQRKENDAKAPVVFSNCQVTIHNFISS